MPSLKCPKPITIDFEGDKIEGRPKYPPRPVGVSIKHWGKKARYYAWGHPTKNNCTLEEARKALEVAWAHKDGLLFHHGKFDTDVAEVHLKLPLPSWDRIHDTLFLLFLDDPHQAELSLKPASERLLNLPPDEQDAVMDWLLTHQPVPGVKLSKSKSSQHYWGAYIGLAPGDLVGTYANGDTTRTEQLFALLYKKTVARGMLRAYDRERQLMPILLEMERRGVPVDLERLRKDCKSYQGWLETINKWVIKHLGCTPDINLDSGDQLVAAMLEAGKADPSLMARTAGGKISTAKDSLLSGVSDKQLLAVMTYRTQLQTCLRTFMLPWLATAEASAGLIYTSWNQTRQPKGDDTVGTRTGRLSSTPNFQNIPLEFKPLFKHELKGLPVCPFKGLPPLPQVRSYITAFEGHVMIDRDYSQQEPRILGHFEGGVLCAQYKANPWLDVHDNAQAELAKAGKHYPRKPVKNTNLGLIYGMGVGKLAYKNEMTVEEAGALKNAILDLYPGLKDMYKEMKRRARVGEPIRTWGGREYYCEPAKIVQGRLRQFDYKLINVLVQGSAADCTKEAIIRFDTRRRKLGMEKRWFLILNIHDQLTCSVPTRDRDTAMRHLQVEMESIEFDIPMLTEGSVSTTNWAELKVYDKRGQRVREKAT